MQKKVLIVVGSFVVIVGMVTGLMAARSLRADEAQERVIEAENTGSADGFSLKEVVDESSRIVIGKSIEARSQWIGRSIYTIHKVEVSETLKGEATSTITLAIPGGTDPNGAVPIGMSYAGAPVVQQDENVFLFLKSSDELLPESFLVTGFNQGKFSIIQDEKGNTVVARDQSVSRGGQSRMRAKVAGIDYLSEFKERVKSHIK